MNSRLHSRHTRGLSTKLTNLSSGDVLLGKGRCIVSGGAGLGLKRWRLRDRPRLRSASLTFPPRPLYWTYPELRNTPGAANFPGFSASYAGYNRSEARCVG